MKAPHPCLPSPWASAVDWHGAWAQDPTLPIIWSIAGTDSGGGAGLSADQRAAAALGVHLCPVVAAVTAQHSRGVVAVHALPPAQLQSQLDALAIDLRPRVIKTGLLASVAAVQAVARCVDDLRRDGSVALVVDPVLAATAGGAAFADAALIAAYRELLLPRATLVTPNHREAERLAGVPPRSHSVPQLAQALRELGAQAVCITGGDSPDPAAQDLALDWLASELADGWLALPRLPSTHHHGSGCCFASAAAAGLARGHALPDAVLLAKMLAWTAVRDGYAAGAGAGPVRPGPGFIKDPGAMPVMGFGEEFAPARWGQVLRGALPPTDFQPGLYAITDDAGRVAELAAGGRFAHIQLRIKDADATPLPAAIAKALQASQEVWINDHWELALACGACALHLGQQDWAALPAAARARLLQPDVRLGISSHSLWELARARGLAPHYIACGPIWATSTKHMPWQPQGLDNLAWWVRMAGRPVVAIGGITTRERLQAAQAAGPAAVCLVRGLELAQAPG
ncbi:PfkB family carbohydrate kinase [Paucibacter soli]|uniref:PfkB family carbohydrate kinase n=1 Tax=Paucibacter soli TaxID=3133433 RepID=UPI0030B2607D